jgi:hypothetical protein
MLMAVSGLYLTQQVESEVEVCGFLSWRRLLAEVQVDVLMLELVVELLVEVLVLELVVELEL